MNVLKTSWPIFFSVALTAAASSGGANSRAVEIAIKDRTNANPSLATTGRFVGIAWAASTEAGVTDVYVATRRDGVQRSHARESGAG